MSKQRAHREAEELFPTSRPAPVRTASATVTQLPEEAPQTMMHPGVYKLALLCWVGLLAVFWITFWMSTGALFMITVGTFYAVMFFGVPYAMTRQTPAIVPARSLAGFARGRFATLYGPVSGADALLQVILVPLLLALGGVAFGIIIHWARAGG